MVPWRWARKKGRWARWRPTMSCSRSSNPIFKRCARGGKLFVFADPRAGMHSEEGVTVIEMPAPSTALQAPVIFAVPLQLLAYHVAVLKGPDVDHPPNLPKSLTVQKAPDPCDRGKWAQ